MRLFDLTALRTVIEAHPGRAGARRLAKVLDEHTVGTTHTNAGLEERFFLLCRDHGIPDPVVKATDRALRSRLPLARREAGRGDR